MAVKAVRGYDVKKPKRGIISFTEWKQKALELMIQDDELTKLLNYNTPNWKRLQTLTEAERENLVDKRIFTHRVIDHIAEDQQSFVSMSLDYFQPFEDYRSFSEKYIMGYMYFYIMTDRGIRRTPLGDRADLISGRILEIFEGSKDFGIGEMEFKSQGEIYLDKGTYGGNRLAFQIVEFRER